MDQKKDLRDQRKRYREDDKNDERKAPQEIERVKP